MKRKIKKNVLILFTMLISIFCFPADVKNYLESAINEYEAGNYKESIKNIDAAKKILEEKQMTQVSDEYIEITNWDVVKLKRSEYLGKKIKIKAELSSISSDGSVLYIMTRTPYDLIYCKFDQSLIDTILSLGTSNVYFSPQYYFYGIIKKRVNGNYVYEDEVELYITYIE